jgi:shikimate kinase
MSQSWVLVGMMGAGKSSVGRRLAELADREFIDTDQLLQKRFGRSISQIFSLYGEETFRDHEHSVLKTLEPGASIISTGGGIVLREDNWQQLRRLGPVVYLKAAPETLIERLQTSKKKRPLLDSEDWEDRVRNILSSRVHLYEQADIVVDLDQVPIQEAAEHLYHQLVGNPEQPS